MSLDISDVEARTRVLEAEIERRALAALRGVAADAQASMQATTAHGDVTGATRAGYRAYAVGPGETGAAALASAVSAVEARNPGHSATASGSLGGDLGLVLTSPTDYQASLEVDSAGARAVLGPTIEAIRDACTQAVARGGR